jgi:hypothetical protein
MTKAQEIHAARQTVEVELGGRSRGAGDAPGGRERGRSQIPIAAGECRLTALAGREKALGQSGAGEWKLVRVPFGNTVQGVPELLYVNPD